MMAEDCKAERVIPNNKCKCLNHGIFKKQKGSLAGNEWIEGRLVEKEFREMVKGSQVKNTA